MSTRSCIALQYADKIAAIYCHFDGYPSGVGSDLKTYYTDFEKVESLILLGDISSLGEDERSTSAYHRDRGEELHTAEEYASFKEWAASADGSDREYFYLYRNGEWEFYDNDGGKLKRLE